MGALALCVQNSLRDSLSVERLILVDEHIILHEHRTSGSNSEYMLIVVNGVTVTVGKDLLFHDNSNLRK
jgi:hypothetical protein